MEANPFKAGDVVRVINDGGAFEIKRGDVYRVTEAGKDDALGNYVEVFGKFPRYYAYRFELVEEAPAKPQPKAKKKAVKPKKQRVKKVPYQSVRAALHKKMKEKGLHSLCHYALQFADNKIRYQVSDICFARTRYYPSEGEHNLKAIAMSLKDVSRHMKMSEYGEKEGMKMFKQYADYVVNRSPWASCFHGAKPSVFFRYGLLMNVSKTISQVTGAMVALREGWEFPRKLPIFTELVKLGYSEHTAYLMSCMFLKKEDGSYQLLEVTGGHQAFFGGHDFKGLIKFFKEGFHVDTGEKPYSECGRAYYIFNAVGKTYYNYNIHPKSWTSWNNDNVKVTKEGQGWNARFIVTREDYLATADKLEKLIKGE